MLPTLYGNNCFLPYTLYGLYGMFYCHTLQGNLGNLTARLIFDSSFHYTLHSAAEFNHTLYSAAELNHTLYSAGVFLLPFIRQLLKTIPFCADPPCTAWYWHYPPRALFSPGLLQMKLKFVYSRYATNRMVALRSVWPQMAKKAS